MTFTNDRLTAMQWLTPLASQRVRVSRTVHILYLYRVADQGWSVHQEVPGGGLRAGAVFWLPAPADSAQALRWLEAVANKIGIPEGGVNPNLLYEGIAAPAEADLRDALTQLQPDAVALARARSNAGAVARVRKSAVAALGNALPDWRCEGHAALEAFLAHYTVAPPPGSPIQRPSDAWPTYLIYRMAAVYEDGVEQALTQVLPALLGATDYPRALKALLPAELVGQAAHALAEPVFQSRLVVRYPTAALLEHLCPKAVVSRLQRALDTRAMQAAQGATSLPCC